MGSFKSLKAHKNHWNFLWLKAPAMHSLLPNNTSSDPCCVLHYLQELTLAGVWIQMAALNRMWSHSCFKRGAPCVRPSRYFAKQRNCSNTALVMCAREDCRDKHKVVSNNHHVTRSIHLWVCPDDPVENNTLWDCLFEIPRSIKKMQKGTKIL